MNCPKCPGQLEDHEIEGLHVDCCFVCEGLWFDAGELQEVLQRDGKDLDFVDVGGQEYDGLELKKAGIDLDNKTGACPRCNDKTSLVPHEYEKNHTLKIDVCPKGHGVWLDGGEIQKMRQ